MFKTIKRFTIFSFFICSQAVILTGQTNFNGGGSPPPTFFADIVPPSPTAASLGKYGNIPVSYHTGTPNISIPLYELKGRELNLPISMSYHASGVRVEEVASWVGLGWSLNAGGVITRTVYGNPDENKVHPKGYLHSETVPDIPFLPEDEEDYLCSIGVWKNNDGQPDMFNINVNGLSGEFFFDQNGNPHLSPYQNIKIETLGGNTQVSFTYFKVTAPDGIVYYFGRGNPASEGSREETLRLESCGVEATTYVTTAWYLSKIVHPNGEEIVLSYSLNDIKYELMASEQSYYLIPSPSNLQPAGGCTPINTIDLCYTQLWTTTPKLTKISSRFYDLEFVHNTNEREDLFGGVSLDKIIVKQNGKQLQSFDFEYDYLGAGSAGGPSASVLYPSQDSKRLMLNSITPSCSPPYTFEYITTEGFASRLSRAKDHWGFFNGQQYNTSLIPTQIFNDDVVGTADREPRIRFAKQGSLEKITYPTGGWTELEYEQNTYGDFPPIFEEEETNTYGPITSEGDGNICLGSPHLVYEAFSISGTEASGQLEVSFDLGGQPVEPDCMFAQLEKENSSGNYVLVPGTFIGVGNISTVTVNIDDLEIGNYRLVSVASRTGEVTTAKITITETITLDTPITSKLTGGIRIKKMTDYSDTNSEPVTQEFEYSVERNGLIHSSGYQYLEPNYRASRYREIFPIQQGNQNWPYPSQPDIYEYCEYQTFVSTSNTPLFYQSGNSVGYEHVKVNFSDGGSSTYKYTTAADMGSASSPYAPFRSTNWKKGLLLEKHDQGNGTTRTEINSYRLVDDDTYGITNCAKAVMAYKHVGVGECGDPNNPNAYKYDYSQYVRNSPVVFLDTKKVIQDGVETVTNFTYDDYTLNQISSEIENSDGRKYKSETVYPEINDGSCLAEKHIYNSPIETKNFVDGTLTGGSKTIFTSEGNRCLPTSHYEILQDGSALLRGTATYITDQIPLSGLLETYQPNFFNLINEYAYYESGQKSGLLKSRTLGDWEWEYDWNEDHRQISSLKDINDIESTYDYDDCSRVIYNSERNGSIFSTYNYQYNLANNAGFNYVKHYNSANKLNTFQYFDGLGRPLQNVLQKYAPDRSDVVQSAVIYDGTGKPYLQYLPFVGGNNGDYVVPYGPLNKLEYEISPQDREVKRTFADNTTNLTNYTCNSFQDVVINHHTGGIYPYCTLNKTSSVDENGHITETYIDKIGQLILTRKFVDGDTRIDTYNEYDTRGNIIKIHPPGGTEYTYVYDNRNRLIQKSVPGAGIKRYTYNDRDEIISEVDANGNNFTFQYDEYGRLLNKYANGALAIGNEYDSGSGAVKGKLTKETVGILSSGGTSAGLETTYKFDNIGRLTATAKDNIKQGIDITSQSYIGGTDYIQTMDKVHNGFIKQRERYTYDHNFRLKETWHKINNEDWALLSAMGYNYRDELIGKAIGGHNHGDVPQVLQSIGYGYNVRGWLNTINYLPLNGSQFTIDGPCIGPSDSLTTISNEACAYEVDLAQLLGIRENENLNVDCYDPCEGYVEPPSEGPSSIYCDYVVDFSASDLLYIDAIKGNNLINLPNYSYFKGSPSSGELWPGFIDDLKSWLISNGYLFDDIYFQQDLESIKLIIKNSNYQFLSIHGQSAQEGVRQQFNFVTENCDESAPNIPRPEEQICSYSIDRYFQSPLTGIHALGYQLDLPNYPYIPINTNSSNNSHFIYENFAEDLHTWLLDHGFRVSSVHYNFNLNDRELIIADTDFPFYSLTFEDVEYTQEQLFEYYGGCVVKPPSPPVCRELVIQPAFNLVETNVFSDLHGFPTIQLGDSQPGWHYTYDLDNVNWNLGNQGSCTLEECNVAEGALEVGYNFPIGLNASTIYDYSVNVNITDFSPPLFIQIGLLVDNEFLELTSGETVIQVTEAGTKTLRPKGILTDHQVENMQVAILLKYNNHAPPAESIIQIDYVWAEFKYLYECSSCPPPTVACGIGEQIRQQESLITVLEEVDNVGVNSDIIKNLPVTLFRVTLCNGDVYYLFQDEINLLEGSYSIDQEIVITSEDQTFTLGSGTNSSTTSGGGSASGGPGVDVSYDNINIPDLFGIELHYYDKHEILEAPSQYNGNISWMKWQVKGHYPNYYGFQYDELDRLKRATFGEDVQGGFIKSERYSVFSHTNNQIQYDKRGNIEELVRGGRSGNCQGPIGTFGIVDDLKYYYGKGNQLTTLTDQNDLAGGIRYSQSDMQYDPNGNLITDSGKKITEVKYNHLNLPESMFIDQGEIHWTYDAQGNKLSKKVNDLVVKEYMPSGVEYDDFRIEAIYTSEGRIIPMYNSEIPLLIDSFRYEYVLRDHLGNGRVYFSDHNEDSKITVGGLESEILQENHYYPFGLNMEGNWYPQQPVRNGYQYNGKELNEEFGLNWNDYGARWYEPAICRFTGVDPIADQFAYVSTYNYAENYPTGAIDLWGLQKLITTNYSVQRDIQKSGEYSFSLQQLGPAGISDGGNWEGYKQNNQFFFEGNKVNSLNDIEGFREFRDAEQAKFNKSFGNVVENVGMGVKYTGLATSIFAPEIGIPLTKIGSGIEATGVGIQIAAEVAEGDYKEAGQKILLEAASKVIGDKGAKAIRNGNLNDQPLEDWGILHLNNVIDVTKQAVQKEDEKEEKKD